MQQRFFAPTAHEDRYEVLDFLAEGGMGSIYLGKKLGAGGFEKEVVLKQLRPEYTEHPEFIELFLREAKLSASLDHANVVHTLDLVRAGDDYFMVMEYVRGGDLRVLLKRAKKRKKRLPAASALFIAREILAALVYAHERKRPDGRPLELIHRDVSPSNILLSGAGEVKLTDFGIAKATTSLSTFFRVRGKVGYMSPEQARNQPLLPRSDLYSVAAILYEMLTGEKLHVHGGLTDDIYAVPVPAVTSKAPKLPSELDGVMWRGLAVDPNARYQTARDMLDALQQIAEGHGLLHDALTLSRHLIEVCGPVEEWGSANVPEAAAPVAEATAGLPPEEASASVPSEVESDGRPPRATVGPDLAKFAGKELRPVAEFIADRVERVEPAVTRARKRRGPLVALLLALAVGAGLVTALVVTRSEAPPPAPAAAPAPPKPAPARPPVKISVDSDPPRARVVVDGQARCLTPCTFDTPAGAARQVTVEKEGYVTFAAQVGEDQRELHVKLRRR